MKLATPMLQEMAVAGGSAARIEGRIDHQRLHIFGRIPHEQLQKLYRRSTLHVYLSKAFVLS